MSEEPPSRPHHKPAPFRASWFEDLEGGTDPALVTEAADRAAVLLVRGARRSDDADVAERLLHLADTEGIETIAEVWSGSPADSLAGCLWRLFVLRSWVHREPFRAARTAVLSSRTSIPSSRKMPSTASATSSSS